MKRLMLCLSLLLALSICTAVCAAQSHVASPPPSLTENVLHTFSGFTDGLGALDLLPGPNGSFYGSTGGGGNACSCGTVYQLTPSGSGWKKTTIYAFNGNPDGSNPVNGLISDNSGNLYGATQFGGVYESGTVFELSPLPNGTWHEAILYSFGNGPADGTFPSYGRLLLMGGALFGVTYGGGGTTCEAGGGCGTVYQLTPSAGGWNEKIIFDFDTSGGEYGIWPNGGLITNAPGVVNLPPGGIYGTTIEGGKNGVADNGGVVFQLLPMSNGEWTITLLHTFQSYTPLKDGYTPRAGLFMDANGNLFGTTQQGGNECPGGGCWYGTVYEVSPGSGRWTEQVIYRFTDQGGDGYYPASTPIADSSGALYATTYYGANNACFGGCGMAFKLVKTGDSWQESILFDFNGFDGSAPLDLVLENGSLFGPAASGGTDGYGLIFQLN